MGSPAGRVQGGRVGPQVTEGVEPEEVEPEGSQPEEVEPEPVAPEVEGRPPRRLGLVIGVGVTVLVLDQLTKHWALNRLSGGRIVDVVGSLRFNLTFNTGASFSIGSDSGIGPWVGLIALVVVFALAMGETSRAKWGAVAAGLIGGGAIGNLVDRAFRGDDGFMHGGVVDFIDLQWWPVFNIADMGVVVGAILLVVSSLRTD